MAINLYPTRDKYIDLRKNFDRVPILGEKFVSHFNPTYFFRHMIGNVGNAFLLESGKGPETTARYTMMGQSNSKILQANQNEVVVSNNGTREVIQGSPLSLLEHLNFEWDGTPFDYVPHFWGGWVGAIGYEMARWLDAVDLQSQDDLNLPLLHFFQVDQVWVYDHTTQILKRVLSKKSLNNPQKYYYEMAQEIERDWHQADLILDVCQNPTQPTPPISSNGDGAGLRPNISKSQYVKMVDRAKRYIEEGDIYQANLSQRFEAEFKGEPLDIYENLQQINPSPFSGYLKLGDLTLVSSSPERLVKIENGILETRPIAGTRPRGRNTEEDDHLTTELLLNEKEQAEHLMLVDLERNDLGRVCEYGSVQVTDQMFVEQYSHVSHIVSNIRGTLKPDVTFKEILKAVFPGGTITGCPKIRCMEIIDELEPVARGPYSGSFGYIGFADYIDLNIIIRTILLKDNKAYFHVGAGIVADSIPEKEYQETLDKAAAMITVLTGKRDF
jgi:anthranilate synthase component 1/para-aminobenzoate synthetase component 1